MSKVFWKPGTLLYPLPVVLVSCGNATTGYNLITIAWTGTICTDPAMLYISLRPSRFSYDLIKKTGEFVVNLTTEKLVYATDFCGVRSGREVDKFVKCQLTPEPAMHVGAPLVKQSPIHLECRLLEIKPLGSHDMFLAQVVGLGADAIYLDEKGALDMKKAALITYSHGKYYALGRQCGHFGYSVKKR